MTTAIPPRRPGYRNTTNWPPYLFEMANDPMLLKPGTHHETHGTLRLFRVGYRGEVLRRLLNTPATLVMAEYRRGIDQEQAAHARGMRICDGTARRGYK